MVYVPSGTLHIGPSDQDVANTYVQRQKAISISGFYMDEKKVIKRLPFNILNPCSAVFQLELEQVYLLAPLTFIYNVHKCTTLPRCYSNGL